MNSINRPAIERIFLHIGRGKTGTTAIQAYCHANRDVLKSNGVQYLASGGGAGGHQGLAKAFIKSPPHYMSLPSASPSALLKKVSLELRTCTEPSCLISSENFVFAELDMLAEFLRQAVPTVEVIIIYFARSQDELAESEYNQMIRWTGVKKSFQDYVKDDFADASFYDVLKPWAEVFGRNNIVAKLYRADQRSVIADFLSCLPGQWNDDSSLTRDQSIRNPSAGRFAIELCREINDTELDIASKRVLNERIATLLAPVDQPALFFTAAEAKRFRELFNADNRLFLSDYLGQSGSELNGRRYTDLQRDEIISRIQDGMSRSDYWRDRSKAIADWL